MKPIKDRLRNLLRKLERVTHTDNVYLAKTVSVFSLVHVVGVLNGFVLYLLIARFLPKEVYGEYKYFLSLFGLFSIVTYTSMESALLRSVAKGLEGSLDDAFKRKLLGGALGSLLAVGAAIYYGLHGNITLSLGLAALACFAPWIYAANVYGAFFTGKKMFRAYGRLNIMLTFLAFVIMAVAFIFLRDSVLLFLAFLGSSSLALFGVLAAKRALSNTEKDPDLIPLATHLSLLDILSILANNIDGLLIYHFLGSVSLAIYALAIIPAEQMKGLLKSVESAAMPKFSVADLPDMRRSLPRKIGIFIAFNAVAIAGYILLAPIFYRIFFPAYTGSVIYSQFYAISIVFAAPASLLLSAFRAQGLRRETTIFNFIAYGSQIIFLVIGVWFWGIWGVVGARTASRGLMLITSWFLLTSGTNPASPKGSVA